MIEVDHTQRTAWGECTGCRDLKMLVNLSRGKARKEYDKQYKAAVLAHGGSDTDEVMRKQFEEAGWWR